MTEFIDYGVVTNANCGGANGGPFAAMAGAGNAYDSAAVLVAKPPVPMAMPANRSGPAVPLSLYAPGFDLSNFIIFDPSTAEWVSGEGYSAGPGSLNAAEADGPQPMGAGSGGSGGTNAAPQTGFYEVVKEGVSLFDVTNRMVLSGLVPLNVEYANTHTNETLATIYLANTDTNFNGSVTGSSFTDPSIASNGLTGVWDTTQVTNGFYTIQLGAILSDGTYLVDHAVTVTVSNFAWTPDPWNVAGFAIYVGVQTVFTNGGTFRMDIYDNQMNQLGYLNGTIGSDGYLDYPGIPGPGFSLNNTDGNGNQLPYPSYQMVYTISPVSSGNQQYDLPPPYTFSNTVATETAWNFAPTTAAVIYQEVFSDDTPDAQNEEFNMMLYIRA